MNNSESRVCLFCHLVVGLLWRISNSVQPISSWALDPRTSAKNLWAAAAKPRDCAGPELGLGSGPDLGVSPEPCLCLRRKPQHHPKCPLLTPAGAGVAESEIRLPAHMWRKYGYLASHQLQARHPESWKEKEGPPASGLWWKSLETPVLEQKSWHLLPGS